MSQDISSQSWGSRILGSFMGILIGIALIIISFILIFWNESHGLHTAQSLQQTQQVLITVPNSPVDPKNNLKVIYFNGLATTESILTDSALGVSQNALKLDRNVEMYQWKEHKDTKTENQIGGSEKQITTYTYKQVWSNGLIDSSEFKEQAEHQNPSRMPLNSLHEQAKTVTVGDFHLPSDMISEISGSTAVDLSKKDITSLQKKLNKLVLHDESNLYIGADPQYPKIGDIKITVSVVLPQTVSIIAQQIDNTVQPYLAPAGKSVSLLSMGTQSPEQMIHDAVVQNQMMTWLIRLGSLLLMIFGISLLMKPLVVLADIIPFFGTIVGFGTGLIAFVVGLILWAAATAIAWFTFRPLWALGLIVVAVIISYLLFSFRKKQVPSS